MKVRKQSMANQISVGIDLGTTFSAAAFINDNGQPEIIVNQSKNNAVNLPSVVFYQSESSITVGEGAFGEAQLEPDKVIQFGKRYMGLDFPPDSPQPYGETPVKFQSKILAAVKKYVEEHANDYEIKNAVITVPAYFDFNKRNLTRDAAEIAEIEVLGIINEPEAAAIYYCSNYGEENQKFLVYDLGGGTFDSVIIDYQVGDEGAKIVTLASDGNHQLGGHDWDRHLVTLLFEKAKEQNTDILASSLAELDPDDRQMLWEKANDLKIILSDNEVKTVPLRIEGCPAKVTVTRAEFEILTKNLLDETGKKVDSVLRQAGLTESDIDLVLLVGGSSFMPAVQNYVRDKFGADKVKLNNPNLAVAYGAAIYAHNMDYYKSISEDPIPVPPSQGEVDWPEEQITSRPDIGIIGPGEVVHIASHSVGVRASVGDSIYVVNMIYVGDQLPIDVSRDTFISPSDGGFAAVFYQNTCSKKITPMEECESMSEYLSINADAFVHVEKNREEDITGPETTFRAIKSTDELTYLGELLFEDDRIRASDPIKVTLRASQEGIFAVVEHIPTEWPQEIPLVNERSMTDDEKRNAKEDLSKTNFSLI